ncbi:hypothetical protein K9M74_04990 [Candidatus Woesearchaeota archaeon]|nr:hypothetical protein [Candidatus Woesearchaeota archaeon]
MVVEFSKQFLKELKKHSSKIEAKSIVKKLAKTSPSDGDFVALMANIIIREKRMNSFRFYFITQDKKKHIITKDELKDFIIKFVALSKKNNQQEVINKLKEDLKQFEFKM